jgi:hypothetical protein
MKKLLLVVGLLFAGMTNHAQSNEYIEMARAILEKDTKEAIAEVMELDDSQSEEFWLLVNEYNYVNLIIHIEHLNEYFL